uniref:Uncharacterized protein n=1 Tax=Cacopsylla melanoneura TaxID=428564 RepID=A0A8D8XHG6_9HEMI
MRIHPIPNPLWVTQHTVPMVTIGLRIVLIPRGCYFRCGIRVGIGHLFRFIPQCQLRGTDSPPLVCGGSQLRFCVPGRHLRATIRTVRGAFVMNRVCRVTTAFSSITIA